MPIDVVVRLGCARASRALKRPWILSGVKTAAKSSIEKEESGITYLTRSQVTLVILAARAEPLVMKVVMHLVSIKREKVSEIMERREAEREMATVIVRSVK